VSLASRFFSRDAQYALASTSCQARKPLYVASLFLGQTLDIAKSGGLPNIRHIFALHGEGLQVRRYRGCGFAARYARHTARANLQT
jgi:hypothetical protein